MKRLLIAATVALAPLAAHAEPLTVTKGWARPAMAGMMGAGFFTLANGKTPESLTAAASPLAAKVEIHRSSMAGGVMSMARQDTVPVPAGAQVVFAPGGYHLMLMGLKQTLKAGDVVPVTLTFAGGKTVAAELKVAVQAP